MGEIRKLGSSNDGETGLLNMDRMSEVLLVTARGGEGKTRLAVEFLAHCRRGGGAGVSCARGCLLIRRAWWPILRALSCSSLTTLLPALPTPWYADPRGHVQRGLRSDPVAPACPRRGAVVG